MLAFFGEEAVRRAIEDLARSDRVTVLAGAGASMEIGLPSWEGLVLALLDNVVDARGWTEDAERFRNFALGSGLLATAEIITALVGPRAMPAAIKRHLYGDTDPAGLLPGPLARGIAAVQHEFGPGTRVATTNYDEVLEAALRERPTGQRWWAHVRSSVEPDVAVSADTVTVTHLHGLLGRRDRGTIVLAEGDYQRMQLDRSWQEEWMVDALRTTTCLFVGASMTDANLIRYLYRARGGVDRRPHVALFRRREAPTAMERRFRSRAEQADSARWERLGITPLYADTFADVAQFVHEVAYRRECGRRTYLPLPDRVADWFAVEAEEGSLYGAEDEGYQEVQQLLQEALEGLIDDVRTLLAHEGVDTRSERIGLALWALHPPEPGGMEERATILASSDRVMTSVDSIAPVPLEDWSGFTGVKAICRGVPLEEEKDTYASRWRFVLGFPVYSDSPRMPLGALTVATMTPAPDTALAGLPARVANALNELVVRSARTLLNISALDPDSV
ncbi:MAG: SIR2 family protein [Acidimicrobiales bacterium]